VVLAALALALWLAARPPEAVPLVSPRPYAVVQARVVSPLKEDRRGEKVIVQTEKARLLAFLPDGAGVDLRPGLGLTLSGRLRRPRAARNPGEFDERRFLADRGVGGVLHAESVDVDAQPLAPRWTLWAWAEGARRSFETALRGALPEPQSRLAVGLALGYKGPLPSDLNRAVQDAGVMHLLVPSGAKVAFVMLSTAWLALRLRLYPAWRALLAAAAGGFYTLMVGGDAPYARAFFGGGVLLASPLLGRDPGPLQAIALSALAILLYDPRELHSVGFQMTYAAVLGLALGLPRLRTALPRRWPRRLREAAVLAGIGAIVQAMLWPIFAQVFGKGSLVGPMANILLVPFSSLLMGAAFLTWLTERAAPLLLAGVEAFAWVCRFFASWPGAAVPLSPMSPAGVTAYYLAAGALLLWPEKGARRALLAGSALALASAWRPETGVRMLLLSRGPEPPPALLSFGNRHWLIDPAGPAGPILAALKARGVERLEAIVASRPVPERLLAKLPADRRLMKEGRPWELRLGTVRVRFGGDEGPRLFRTLHPDGEGEYCIIPLRLKSSAVELFIDGESVRIEASP
jgi:competence protein ComEC